MKAPTIHDSPGLTARKSTAGFKWRAAYAMRPFLFSNDPRAKQPTQCICRQLFGAQVVCFGLWPVVNSLLFPDFSPAQSLLKLNCWQITSNNQQVWVPCRWIWSQSLDIPTVVGQRQTSRLTCSNCCHIASNCFTLPRHQKPQLCEWNPWKSCMFATYDMHKLSQSIYFSLFFCR